MRNSHENHQIDNPTPQQRMEEMDQQYMAEQFYEHCTDRANEIAKEFYLLPEFYEDFAEYFADVCRESDDGYSLSYSKDLIEDWWDEYGDDYDNYSSPYDIDPTPQYLYDDTGGEPPISAEERNRKAFEQKLIDKG